MPVLSNQNTIATSQEVEDTTSLSDASLSGDEALRDAALQEYRSEYGEQTVGKEDAIAAVQNAGLPPERVESLLKAIDQIYDVSGQGAFGIFAPTSDLLTAEEVIEQIMFLESDIANEELALLEKALSPEKRLGSSFSEVDAIILDPSIGPAAEGLQPSHSTHDRTAERLFRENASHLKDNEVMRVGGIYSDGTWKAALRDANLLVDRVIAEGGNAPAINISAELGPDLVVSYDDVFASASSIDPKELGYTEDATLEQIAAHPAIFRVRIEGLAREGHKGAQEALEVADQLLTLADKGSPISIAWGNKDHLNVVALLTQHHPQIEAVAALDPDGGLDSHLNKTTGDKAERLHLGTVVHLPPGTEGRLDLSGLGGVPVHYDLTSRASLGGLTPDQYLMSDDVFVPLADEYRTLKEAELLLQLRAVSEKFVEAASSGQEVDFFAQELSFNYSPELTQMVKEIGIASSWNPTDPEFMALLAEPQTEELLNQYFERKNAEQLAIIKTPVSDFDDLDARVVRIEEQLSGVLLTSEQYETLTGAGIPSQSDSLNNDESYFHFEGFSDVKGQQYGVPYTAFATKDGGKILGFSSYGTSWASPSRLGERLSDSRE